MLRGPEAVLSAERLGDAVESLLALRVREAIHGQDVIDWDDRERGVDFGRFFTLVGAIALHDDGAQLCDGAIYVSGLPEMVRLHAERPTRHILVTDLSENWGAFATHVPERTVDWGEWSANLARAGCTLEAVRAYLDDPRVKAVVTTQHVALLHPKIVTLPIGVRHPEDLMPVLEGPLVGKTRDLLINNSEWQHRRGINERVSANFGGTITNTYGQPRADYFASIMRSRFVLCPSGLGWDSRRIWETLLLGSIPIVERSPGWDRVLDDLPALTVSSFDEVTPALLADAYPEILSRWDRFDFGKLTQVWWRRRIIGLLAGS